MGKILLCCLLCLPPSEDLWFISPVIYLLLRSVVHCLTLIPLFAGWLWTIIWTFFVMARHVIRPGYMCLSIMKHIGGSILATTHYPRFYVIILIYIISWWSFSWYFGTSYNYYHQQQPDLAISNHRLIYLFLIWTFRHAPSQSQIAHFLLGKTAIFAYFWAAHHRSTVIFQIFLCQHDMYTCVQLLVQ